MDNNEICKDKIIYHKMTFIMNALEKGWSVKKKMMNIFFRRNTKIVVKYLKNHI